jgi:cysteine synthase A
MQVAEKAPAGSVLLAMLPDTGERYLSTPLFDGIVEVMDDDEIAVMKSTPNYQMP